MGARSTDAAAVETPRGFSSTGVAQGEAPFRLGEWVVDPRAGSLRKGATETRLEPKVMAVLLCLARRAGDLVVKGELLDAVWPDTHVHEVALTRSISELRRRLGDNARAPRWIETLPKRGYRLMVPVEPWVDPGGDHAPRPTPVGLTPVGPASVESGPVESGFVESVPVAPKPSTPPAETPTNIADPADPADPTDPADLGGRPEALDRPLARPWAWWVVLVAALGLGAVLWLSLGPLRAPEPSVLVLPLRNLSGDTEADYFSAGVTDDLATLLWRIDGLRVTTPPGPRSTVLVERDLQALGRSRRATTVVDGSVRREGDRLRIVVRLVEVEQGTILWADTYDRDLHDLFDIQNEIAEQIAEALAATIDLEATSAPTDRITAYDLYLRGRDRYQRFDRANNEEAIELYRRALALDADFALAHAELASALALRVASYGFPRGELPAAATAAATALRLDPELPEAHKAQALVYLVEGRPTLAHAEYRRALELRPGYREALEGIATLQIQLGQWDEAGRWQTRRPPRLE